jgi:hypothetical protein
MSRRDAYACHAGFFVGGVRANGADESRLLLRRAGALAKVL